MEILRGLGRNGAMVLSVIGGLAFGCSGQGLKSPEKLQHPALACTAEELGRLKAALSGSGPERELVERVSREADSFLAAKLDFPPRGGQHNQWYQCEKCQLGLETIDETHHRCPRCDTIYTGEPFDDVIFARKHAANLKGLLDCAWAWALTGRREYAERGRAVLLGYAERFTSYPFHDNQRRIGSAASVNGGHLSEQTLGEASSMATRIAPAFDLLHDFLSETDRQTVRNGLLLPMVRTIDRNKAGKSNWQSWHNAALFAGGLLAGDPDLPRRSIEDPANGFRAQMRISVSAEGMWYENSWGYHMYTLSALTAHAEFARRVGIDLWQDEPFRRMFRLPAEYTMADGSLPRFGDDVGTRANSPQFLEMLEHAHAATGDPALRPLLSPSPTWASLLHGRKPGSAAAAAPRSSAVYRSAGHAILRSSGAAGLSAALAFGPYGGFHGHFDKLSFVFFGYGEELGVDPGRARSQAYRLPIHTGWYKATLGHNTVLVNGQSQQPAEGRLLLFDAQPEHTIAAAECDAAYPGVKHTRLLYLGSDYLLVLDTLESQDPVEFGWIYHNHGVRVKCDIPAEEIRRFPFVEEQREGRTDGDLRMLFEGDRIDTSLTMAGAQDTSVLTGHGPLGSVLERVPLVLVSRRGRSALFCAVLEPVKMSAGPTITGLDVTDKSGRLQVTIRSASRTDRITWNRSGIASVNAEGIANEIHK